QDPSLQTPAICDICEPGTDQRTREVRFVRHSESGFADEGAAPARGGEELVAQRVVDDASEAAALVHTADGDAPVRDPVEEVDGPVERIDEPPDPGPAARARAFLRDDAVVRPPRAEVSDAGPLRAPVRRRGAPRRSRPGATPLRR